VEYAQACGDGFTPARRTPLAAQSREEPAIVGAANDDQRLLAFHVGFQWLSTCRRFLPSGSKRAIEPWNNLAFIVPTISFMQFGLGKVARWAGQVVRRDGFA